MHDASLAGRLETRAAGSFLRPVMALAAVMGAVAALSQAPFDLWPLGLIGLAGLYLLFRAALRPLRAFWVGWAGGAGYFAASMFWIVEPFFVDPWRHGWMAPFALIFLAGGLALFWGWAFAVARRWGGAGGFLPDALAWIGALGLAEIARSYVLTGFPWGLIGYVWAASPAAGLAAWIGPHGLSLFALAVAVALARLFGPRGTGRWLALAGLVVVAGALIWAWPRAGGLYADTLSYTAPDAPVIRLIQPNAAQDRKWDPDHIMTFWKRQLEYTAAGQDRARPDLIVWPETAIPWLLDDAQGAFDLITQASGGVPVVLGLRRFDGPRLMNSAVVLDGQAQVTALYDKHHLVPFGEYVPLGDLAARFGIHGLAAGEGDGYSAGPGAALLDLPEIGPALPLICYEAVFPQDVNAAPSRPRVLLQITNDAWFGKFSGPYQHLQQARMRAIEQGLPMIRVANTGVSAMIDAQGRITAQLALNTAGHIDAPLPPALAPTLYSRTRDWAALIAALLALVSARVLARRIAARQPTSGG